MSKKGKSRSTSSAEDLLARIVKLDKRERKARRELSELKARAKESGDITDFVRRGGKIARNPIERTGMMRCKPIARKLIGGKAPRFSAQSETTLVLPADSDKQHVEIIPLFPEACIPTDEEEEGEDNEPELEPSLEPN
jgi:hypothetical protein